METTIFFNEINSLPNGEYNVCRSEDSNCLYKLFSNFDGQFISISKRSSGGYGFVFTRTNEISAHITPYDRNGHNTKIVILLNNKDNLKMTGSVKDNWNHRINLEDTHTSNNLLFSVSLNKDNCSLSEINGQFFINVFGVKFDILLSRANVGTSSDLYTSIYRSDCSFSDRNQKNRYLNWILSQKNCDSKKLLSVEKIEGCAKVFAQIKPFYEKLNNSDDYLKRIAFKLACNGSNRTINNVKFSVALNKLFSNISTEEQFNSKLDEISAIFEKQTYLYRDYKNYLESLLDALPEAREIKKDALKRKSTGAFNKIMDDLDFVTIDEKQFPLTHEVVFSGTLPLGTFFRKSGDSYFVYNDNWMLWEEMLSEYPVIAKQIAEQASKRTTYEKDIMSYFHFVLHSLPEYLEKHTGKKWKGIPKLVQSANELEPPKEGASGTSKTRSALTPIVNNAKNEVTVPYVSMRIGGYQTQYCYALDFNVVDRGFSFNGNVVTKSVEEKLNGRDDYGLMFYTLTGSSMSQGYPTFLIIFERLLKGQTRVHFHRTHPMRSKGGDYNPIHNWTTGCYKWMIGNVNFERIKAQQGDLAFVQIEKFPEGEITEVTTYDGHNFETPVKFTSYLKKDRQNVLGYVSLETDTTLSHNEHMNRIIPAGVYEIRQCRSWEANPIGIWSLRID